MMYLKNIFYIIKITNTVMNISFLCGFKNFILAIAVMFVHNQRQLEQLLFVVDVFLMVH